MSKTFSFDDPDHVRRYADGPARFVPGYTLMHRLVIQLIREAVGPSAHLLVLGAGGGLELSAFCAAMPGWRYTGVDPAPLMLEQARRTLGPAAERVTWTLGYIPDAPPGPYDAATCLLTLHFLPDDGTKLAALKIIRDRLRPGAPFAVVDHCFDPNAPDFPRVIDRYAQFALDSGADPADVAQARERVGASLGCVAPAREEALLHEAGFTDVTLFYAGLAWRGWVCRA